MAAKTVAKATAEARTFSTTTGLGTNTELSAGAKDVLKPATLESTVVLEPIWTGSTM